MGRIVSNITHLYIQHLQNWSQSNFALKTYGPWSALGHAFKSLITNYRQMVRDIKKQADKFCSGSSKYVLNLVKIRRNMCQMSLPQNLYHKISRINFIQRTPCTKIFLLGLTVCEPKRKMLNNRPKMALLTTCFDMLLTWISELALHSL